MEIGEAVGSRFWSQYYTVLRNYVASYFVVVLEPISPTDAGPDLSRLRLIKESELKKSVIIGSGAFGTVFKVNKQHYVIYNLYFYSKCNGALMYLL